MTSACRLPMGRSYLKRENALVLYTNRCTCYKVFDKGTLADETHEEWW